MKRKSFIRKDEEGVSPVIATILMVAITVVLAAVLYIMVIGLAPTGSVIPTGTWGAKTPISNSAYNIDFGKVNPEPKPVDLELLLIRNGTDEGKYSFNGNNDGLLTHADGVDVGTLTYSDLADNQKVNIGDQLKMTNLYPNSDYTLKMIWTSSGDQITSTTFSTSA
ncbi:MAG: type IV pilin N-terminal domain-containing protein [Thermoplasmata archaeon]|nr:type IV pilin N-terminal domain-containing protein [Thermoplasmata archaeon]